MSSATATVTMPAAACPSLYVIPFENAGCAVSFIGEGHKSAMEACCGDADIISYSNDCGLYCAVNGQSVKELQDCLFNYKGEDGKGDRGETVRYQDVFCNAPNNATATATSVDIPASASASVVAGKDSDDKDGDDQDGADKGGDDNKDGDDKDGDKSAAQSLRPGFAGFSVTGVTMGAMLVSAMAFGAVQI